MHQDTGLVEVFQNQLNIFQLDPFVDDVVDLLRPRFQPHMSPDKAAGRLLLTEFQRFKSPFHTKKRGKLHLVFCADVFVGDFLDALRGQRSIGKPEHTGSYFSFNAFMSASTSSVQYIRFCCALVSYVGVPCCG
jgi:hypothetical protein